jgi:type VI secretion system protein VasD
MRFEGALHTLAAFVGRAAPTGRGRHKTKSSAMQRLGLLRRATRLLFLLACAVAVVACAATKAADEALGEMTKNMLEAAGLKKPEKPKLPELPQAEAMRLPRKVSLRVHAGPQLNHDVQERPLSLVLRIYKLKTASTFRQAPYEVFATAGKDKEFLGDDMLEMREVLLTPGQRLAAEEKLPREAAVLGVVALFHARSPQRWKFAFDAAEAEKTGLVLGAHGCALTVAHGQPLQAPVDALMLGGAPCGQ